MRPTYKEQEKHLHEQYIAGKVEPYDMQFCVCGNLLGKRSSYQYWPRADYTSLELIAIEKALLVTINDLTIKNEDYLSRNIDRNKVLFHPNYETALFNGMVAALEVLKEVHRGWGEDVDGEVEFTRRKQIA